MQVLALEQQHTCLKTNVWRLRLIQISSKNASGYFPGDFIYRSSAAEFLGDQ